MDMLEQNQMVVFRLDTEEYGIFITEINEIIAMVNVTPLAKAEKSFLGVVNLRDEILPLYDLRIQLEKNASPYHKKKRIIVTTIQGKKLGLLVDEVTRVLKIERDLLEEAPDSLPSEMTTYIHGFYKTNEQVITLLNLPYVLQEEEISFFEKNEEEQQ